MTNQRSAKQNNRLPRLYVCMTVAYVIQIFIVVPLVVSQYYLGGGHDHAPRVPNWISISMATFGSILVVLNLRDRQGGSSRCGRIVGLWINCAAVDASINGGPLYMPENWKHVRLDDVFMLTGGFIFITIIDLFLLYLQARRLR